MFRKLYHFSSQFLIDPSTTPKGAIKTNKTIFSSKILISWALVDTTQCNAVN